MIAKQMYLFVNENILHDMTGEALWAGDGGEVNGCTLTTRFLSAAIQYFVYMFVFLTVVMCMWFQVEAVYDFFVGQQSFIDYIDTIFKNLPFSWLSVFSMIYFVCCNVIAALVWAAGVIVACVISGNAGQNAIGWAFTSCKFEVNVK